MLFLHVLFNSFDDSTTRLHSAIVDAKALLTSLDFGERRLYINHLT